MRSDNDTYINNTFTEKEALFFKVQNWNILERKSCRFDIRVNITKKDKDDYIYELNLGQSETQMLDEYGGMSQECLPSNLVLSFKTESLTESIILDFADKIK